MSVRNSNYSPRKPGLAAHKKKPKDAKIGGKVKVSSKSFFVTGFLSSKEFQFFLTARFKTLAWSECFPFVAGIGCDCYRLSFSRQ